MEVQSTARDFMDAYSADKMTETDAQGRFRLGPLRPGTDDVQPDTERGSTSTPG